MEIGNCSDRSIANILHKNAIKLRSYLKHHFNGRFLNVLIDITNGCNLRCSFCTRSNEKTIKMTTADFKNILEKIHTYTRSIQLSCAWEYSIANNASEIIETLGRYSIPEITIYTNGNLLPDYLANTVIKAGINNFVVSIGEVKKETYENIRKGGKFEKVINNIQKLTRLKKENKSILPRLCTNLTLINSNIDELIDFVSLAHELGIEQIRGRHLIINKGLDIHAERITDFKRANTIIAQASKKASTNGIKFSIPYYSEINKPKECLAAWRQLYISSNGDVSICPRIHRYEKIGNIIHDDLKNILTGSTINDLKKQFVMRDFKNPVCRICIQNKESEIAIDQKF